MTNEVVIVSYDPEWSILFAQLGGALRTALGDVALRIDHIGSTSVPGLHENSSPSLQEGCVPILYAIPSPRTYYWEETR